MITPSASPVNSKNISRRMALRLAFAAVPVAASFALPGLGHAGGLSATEPTIEIIDAVSKSAATRASLVPGTYRPGTDTTGPVAGVALTAYSGDFTVTSNGQLIENLDINGRIELKSFSNVIVRNCIVRGTTATGANTCFINATSNDNRGLLVEDTRLLGQGNLWQAGMNGANFTLRRTEINGAVDGLNLSSVAGNVTVEACWIHNGFYAEWLAGTAGAPSQGNNYTHADGIQISRGKNIVIRGNMIGGVRKPNLKPHTGVAAQINAADDVYNSAIMIKQEVDSSAANKIENVVIENNWLQGGCATLNIAAGNGNTFSSMSIRNNRFPRSTWGSQWYILRGSGVANFSGNVFDDDGSAVPIVAA